VEFAVLASARADEHARSALLRACERIPATPEFVDDDDRVAHLRASAARPGVRWIVLVDADAVPFADAFGRLRRALAPAPALLGGRALVVGRQHFGTMFAPPRCGPHPFELTPVSGLAEEPGLFDVIRGPVDVPQRGLIVVSAEFARELPRDLALDSVLLHLDLAVRARAAGAVVQCEPTMSFTADEDGIDVKRRILDVQRFAPLGIWELSSLHFEPPTLRSRLIDRDTRVMGNFRGYAKLPMPPIETIAYGPRDADLIRAALARTGDRYALFVPSGSTLPQATIEVLIERVERSNRHALALDAAGPPYGAVLAHRGRLTGGGTFRGDTAAAVFADAIASLPGQRLYAVGPDGPIVPDALPALARFGSLDLIFVAAAQPMVTNQTIQGLLRTAFSGELRAVYPAGAETTRRLLSAFREFQLIPDATDPILAVGLNRAIAACRSDAIAIVRDDVLVTVGAIERMCDAFARVARLGVAVPRTGGGERLEGLPEITYNNAIEMQSFADRRASQFAREAMLADVATTPAIVVARHIFDAVGGFDETFGFSRFGIEDFARRVRSANYHVARCDDAYVHMFPIEEVESFLCPLDFSGPFFERYHARWAARRGFDPARDAVPLPRPEALAPAPAPGVPVRRLRLLVPVASEAEWNAMEPDLAGLAALFRANDPFEVAIGLDGELAIGTLVARLRELLVRTGVPMEETLNVIVEPVADLAAWCAANAESVRFAACDRSELAELASVADAGSVRARLAGEAV
jgi:hypothetical protein